MQQNIIQNIFLNASAGSGKTFALCIRYIALLFHNIQANEILAITFTKEAANEMKERITTSLFILYVTSLPNNSKSTPQHYRTIRKDLLQALQQYGFNEETVNNNIATIYWDFLKTSKKINTIDSFYVSILKRFAFFIGIKRHFEISDSHIYNESFEYFLKISFQDSRLRHILQYLRKQLQLRINTTPYNNTLNLHELLTTLSDKSIEFRDTEDFFYKMNAPHTLQYAKKLALQHGINENILHSHILEEKIKIQSQLLSHYIKNITPEGKENNKNLQTIHDALWNRDISHIIHHKLIKEKKHDFITKSIKPNTSQYQEITIFCEKIEILGMLYSYCLQSERLQYLYLLIATYKESLRKYENKHNILNFDSIKHKVFEIATNMLQNHSIFNSDYFYFCLDGAISHILFDEYQDTSIVQYRIFLPMFREILAGQGTKEHKSLFFVGDFKQSLYRFRGASLSVFEESKKGLHVKSLTENYRSKKNIITFVNEKFQPIFKEHYILQHYPTNKEDSHNGIVRITIFDEKQHDAHLQDEKDTFKIEAYQNILDIINQLITCGVAKKDIAILARERKHLLDFILFAKSKYPNLEFNMDKSGKLIHQKMVQIIFYVFKIREYKKKLESYHTQNINQNNRTTIHNIRISQSTKSDNTPHMQQYKQLTLYIKSMQKKLNKLLGKSYFQDEHIVIPYKKTLAQEIKFVIEHFNLYDKDCIDLLEIASSSPEIRDIDTLFESIAQQESIRAQQEAIRTMTIHASKGLGFEHVIFLDLLPRKIPQKQTIFYDYEDIYLNGIYLNDTKCYRLPEIDILEKQEILENTKQENNILYVACTRAKSGLYIFAHAQSNAVLTLNLSEKDSKGDIEQIGHDAPITKSTVTKPFIISHIKTHQVMQEEYIYDNDDETLISNIATKKKQIIGLGLHLFLELMLGYNIKNPLSIVKHHFGFYLNDDELQEIFQKAQNFLDTTMQHYFKFNNTMVKCEVSFLQKNNIQRLDAIVRHDNGFAILEFKSSQKLDDSLIQKHEAQIESYMVFINNILQTSIQLKGYLVYLQDNIKVREISNTK